MKHFDKKKSFARLDYILLALFILVGAYLRLKGTFTYSFAFTYDVGRDMLALRDIVTTFNIPFIGFTTGLPGLFYGPWWYYILIPSYLLFGGNPQGIAFFIALSGVASILIAYVLGKRVSGRWLGLCFAGLIAVSPSLVATTTQIWNPNLAPFFVLVFLLLFHVIQHMVKRDMLYKLSIVILGFVAGLILDMEIVYGLLFLASFVIFIILTTFINEKKFLKVNNYLSPTMLFGAGYFVTLFPRILFELKNNFLMTNTIVNALTHSNASVTSLVDFLMFMNSFRMLSELWNYTVSGQNALLGIVSFIICVVTTIWLYKRGNKNEQSLLLFGWITLGVYYVGISLFRHDIFSHYVVGLPIIMTLLLSLSLALIMKYTRISYGVVVFFFVLFVINSNPRAVISDFTQPLWEGDASVYRNQLYAVDYVYKDANNRKFNYVVYTPPIHDYTYQYLFMWYGEKNYGYTPSRDRQELFYLILEPDYEYAFRLENWLKMREGDGKIVEEKKLKGGIIVQKRIH